MSKLSKLQACNSNGNSSLTNTASEPTSEDVCSAIYVETYMDFVEYSPNDIMRCVSRLKELNLTFSSYLKEVEQQNINLHKDTDNDSMMKKKNLLARVQQVLIAAQEVGDEKLKIMQEVNDIIENHGRNVDTAFKKFVESTKDMDAVEVSNKEVSNAHGLATHIGGGSNVASVGGNGGTIISGAGNGGGASGAGSGGGSGGERQSKRVRRTRTDIPLSELAASMETTSNTEVTLRQTSQQATPSSSSNSTGTSQKKAGAPVAGTIGKKKKRKSRQSSQQQQQQQQQLREQREREESPTREDEMPIDPDEPTYCLCNQISYGEMIMCDNDLCPFEWFHFTCVSLITKPKGKWFCPKCRGDRSSIMKPKAQFMKELEKYNKEKELKEEKGT